VRTEEGGGGGGRDSSFRESAAYGRIADSGSRRKSTARPIESK
jgi:hypothetical protein